MKRLGLAAAALVLGTISTPYAASAQSFGVYVGSSGSSYGDYDDDIYYSGSYGRSAYYGGYGVPYAYYGGPRVYGYTQRVSDNRGGYIRDGIPGRARDGRIGSTVYGSVDRRSTPYVRDGIPGEARDRRVSTTRVYGYTQRRDDLSRDRLVRDNIPGNTLERGPRVAGFTQRSNLVIDPPVRSAGGCGTFFYWNGTTCADARLK